MKPQKRMKLGRYLMLGVVGLTLMAEPIMAAEYTSYIVPRVKDASNRPVAGALVCVYDSTGRFIDWDYTNSRGVTKFTQLPAGTYWVYGYKAGVGFGYGQTVLYYGNGPGRPNIKLR